MLDNFNPVHPGPQLAGYQEMVVVPVVGYAIEHADPVLTPILGAEQPAETLAGRSCCKPGSPPHKPELTSMVCLCHGSKGGGAGPRIMEFRMSCYRPLCGFVAERYGVRYPALTPEAGAR